MKKILTITLAALIGCVCVTSCQDELYLESETQVTINYLNTSKEGLQRAIAGLYVYERNNVVDASNEKGIVLLPLIFDFNTDIFTFNAGNWAALGRLETLTPDSGVLEDYWKFHYAIIGRANEIIASAKKLGLDDADIAKVYGEACLFRARAYYNLWTRFERIYLNAEPTSSSNLEREYSPASREDVFKLMKEDLDNAVKYIPYELPTLNNNVMYGRYNKSVARHVRAQVAMWEEDWDEAIAQCESLFKEGKSYNYLESKVEKVFESENLRSPEVLYAYQFSKNIGGGGVVQGSTLKGHPISVYVTSRYSSEAGCVSDPAQGGFGYGRDLPNMHLLNMYGPKDTRKKTLFISTFKNANGAAVTPVKSSTYITNLHPMSIKHADFWTNADEPERKTSFRDLIVYRLAETYLICCEAYFHKGDNANAVKYYNATYKRAGNTAFAGTLTLEDILDEAARELNFEGVRWPQLKRLGLLGQYCHQWAGETMLENPYLDKDYIHARNNFVIGKHETWPIPSNQILLMGGAGKYPQNEGWL